MQGYLTRAQAALELGCTERHVDRLRAGPDPALASVKAAGRVLVSERDVYVRVWYMGHPRNFEAAGKAALAVREHRAERWVQTFLVRGWIRRDGCWPAQHHILLAIAHERLNQAATDDAIRGHLRHVNLPRAYAA